MAQSSRQDPGVAAASLAGRLLEPPLRRALHVYWRFSRGITLGVRGAAIDGDGRVCLIRHTYAPGWQLPGGGVEPGETSLAALEREFAEEAEIALGPAEPRLHGIFLNTYVSQRDHVVLYVVDDFRVAKKKVPDSEIAEAGFFPLDALPNGTTEATRRRLAEIQSGAPVPRTW